MRTVSIACILGHDRVRRKEYPHSAGYVIAISTAPAVDPAIIDLKALGLSFFFSGVEVAIVLCYSNEDVTGSARATLNSALGSCRNRALFRLHLSRDATGQTLYY